MTDNNSGGTGNAEGTHQRKQFFDILEKEVDLEEELSEVPKKRFVIPIIKKNLGIDRTEKIPNEIDERSLKKIYKALDEMIGGYVAELINDILRRPLLLNELRDIKDIQSLDALESKKYLKPLLDFQDSYLSTDEWKESKALLEAADDLLDNISGVIKTRYLGMLENSWGLYYWKSGEYDLAEKKFKNSLGLAKKVNDKDMVAKAYHGLGVLYGDAKEDKMEAVKQNEKCIKTLKRLEQTNSNLRREASVLNNIGVAYHKMAEDSKLKDEDEKVKEYFKRAAENYKEAIDLAVKLNYTHMVGWVSFNLGEIYAYLGEFDKANSCSQDSREIYQKELDNERGLSGVEMLDAVIALQKGDYDSALDYINKSLDLRKKLKEPRRTADALVCRGDINLEMDDIAGAKEDYQESLEIYESMGSSDGVERVKKKISNIG